MPELTGVLISKLKKKITQQFYAYDRLNKWKGENNAIVWCWQPNSKVLVVNSGKEKKWNLSTQALKQIFCWKEKHANQSKII